MQKDVDQGMNTSCLRVLHVLDHSLPRADGYAIRSRGIVNGQRAIGFAPEVLTSPLHELLDASGPAIIDDIPYARTPVERGLRGAAVRARWPLIRELSVISLLRSRILELLRRKQFDLVHAHSPGLCGIAALLATKAAGVPFVYEIRAFWEDAAVDQGRTTPKSIRYKLTRGMEQYVVEHAHAVVGIASSILNDLRARGIDEAKLFHVPNGVEIEKFRPLAPDPELAAEIGLRDGVPVMGFIGSFYYFEGISWLVRAAAELHRRGRNFRLLLIGHGEDEEPTKTAIAACNAGEYVHFLGKVAPDEVRRYYSLMDIMVYPRKSIRLTELVTPLKPLEALAQGKAVLASGVGGIRELIVHEQTGLLFKPESVEDFCQQAGYLLQDHMLRRQLAERGREFILKEKSWSAIVRRYEEVYQKARNNVRRD